MTTEQYNKSLETGELQLSLSGKLSHFGIVIFLCFISIALPAIHLFFLIKGNDTSYKEGEIWFTVVPGLLALIFYKLQKVRLKYHEVNTTLNHDELMKLIEQVAKALKWSKIHSDKKFYIAKTDPGFFSGSWGEQITILFDRNRVLINSICDLDKKSSVVSMGGNRENVNTFIESIEKADLNSNAV